MSDTAQATAVLEPPAVKAAPPMTFDLLDTLLKEQQDLTAVEKFSRAHDHAAEPHQAKYYRDLIPATPPGPGQQYAFEVELDACTGCKSCVTACHTLNGLDESETWRSVGLLIGSEEKPVLQMVTSACHHCLHPACMDGCPAMAYDKDLITGIVKHLDDQCIGCQYCVLKCPYDVPKYSPSRGIVRKCDMCSSRLAASEAPACVQACPNEAIRITTVNQADIAILAASPLLPDCPDSGYTMPSTVYSSRNPLSAVRAADSAELKVEDSHLPLVATLVLTQVSVGVALFCAAFSALGIATTEWLAPLAAAFGVIGVNCAPLHLGRPLYGFRAVLGFRTSWLSREIIAFGAYCGCIVPFAATPLMTRFITPPEWVMEHLPAAITAMGWLSVFAGLGAVFCSAMIYIDTRRAFWSPRLSFPRFFGTTLVLGSAIATAACAWNAAFESTLAVALLFVVASLAKLIFEALFFENLSSPTLTQNKKSALLMCGPLKAFTVLRFACGVLGGPIAGILALAFIGSPYCFWFATAGAALSLCGEFLERYLYFTAAVRLKMPGGLPT